jgi:hypothetical protein
MFEWLKLVTGSGGLTNPDGVPSSQVRVLGQTLAPLLKKKRELPGRLLRYAVDGVDGDALVELAATKDAAEALAVRCCEQPHLTVVALFAHPVRRQSIAGVSQLETDKAAFLRRVAEIFEAASRTGKRTLHLEDTLGSASWLEVFLVQAARPRANAWPPVPAEVKLHSSTIEAMLRDGGEDPSLFACAPLTVDPNDWAARSVQEAFSLAPGFGESVARHAPAVLRTLRGVGARPRAAALRLMQTRRVRPEPFAAAMVDFATESAKTVRDAAEAFLHDMSRETIVPMIEQRAIEGTPDEQLRAIRLLCRLQGAGATEFLARRLEDEASSKVRKEIESVLVREGARSRATADDPADERRARLRIQPLAPLIEPPRLPDEILGELEAMVDERNRDVAEQRREAKETKQRWMPEPIPDGLPRAIFAGLHNGRLPPPTKSRARTAPLVPWNLLNARSAVDRVKGIVARPDFELLHLVRLLLSFGFIGRDHRGRPGFFGQCAEYIEAWAGAHEGDALLRRLAQALEYLGAEIDCVGETLLNGRFSALGTLRAREGTWDYFAARPEILEQALGMRRNEIGWESWQLTDVRRAALEILGTFPSLPEPFVPVLWQLALEGPKADRLLAQKCLEKEQDSCAQVIASLRNAKQDARATAAAWLARLGDPAALEPLRQALREEKSEPVKAAMLNALEALGGSVDEFLDLAGLPIEAQKKLARGIPKDLAWFNFDRLPNVRWEAGEDVPHDVLRWLVVQAHGLKDPEPSSLLRRRVALMRQGDREAFGYFVLSAWLAQDTLPVSREEAIEAAENEAKAWAAYLKVSVETMVQRMLPAKLTQPKGSAIAQKGILAVGAACCGAQAVPLVERYLTQWYGQRAAQCKALLHMLSWIEQPLATQLLLSTANRFRTRSIQDEARHLVDAIAERHGWTMDQLADRTAPTAGFDEQGVLTLDFGPRQFEVRMAEDLTPVIQTPEAKRLKTLPKPGKSDDPEKAREAKKQLTAAKAELKAAVRGQTVRLHEAMCTQRSWDGGEWRAYVHRHPIVGRLAQRLIWTAWRDEECVAVFRPLADGTLTDVEDQEVHLGTPVRVRLAHASALAAETVQAWRGHLEDYEVASPFDQVGRDPYRLSDDLRDATEIADFEGYVIDAFKLRSEAGKLGWTRGDAEDGGVFVVYRKSFPGLQLEAVIEHSGNTLPEENRPMALLKLAFHTHAPASQWSWYAPSLKLRDVPAVLLSECYNDLARLAAEGSGHDPHWQKTCAF